MSKTEAIKLACQIVRDDPQCRVTGKRLYGRSYTLDVVDTRTGYLFVVRDAEDWAERMQGGSNV